MTHPKFLTQPRLDAIRQSRAQVTKTRNYPATTPIGSKRKKINGEGTTLKKTPKFDLNEPSQSPSIHMIEERGQAKQNCAFESFLFSVL